MLSYHLEKIFYTFKLTCILLLYTFKMGNKNEKNRVFLDRIHL